MKLIPNPGADLISYVERIQRRLSRHGLSLQHRNRAFFEAARAVARKHSSELDLSALPDHLRGTFGLLNTGEFLRRIDEAEGMSTAFQSAAPLLQLLNLWYDVQSFVIQVSGLYDSAGTPVFLATAPDWSYNARAFTHRPTGVHIIVFYELLFDLMADVSLALPLAVLPPDIEIPDIAVFPTLASEHFDKGGEASSAVVRRCLQHFIKRHGRRDFTSTFDAPVSESIRLIAQDVELSMQAFVMGHEIAHLLSGHQGEMKFWDLPPADEQARSEQVAERVHRWDQEYEADYIGFKLGRGATIASQIPLATYAWSVLLLFSANEWLMPLHVQEERSHPPFALRKEWIGKIMETEQGSPRLDLRPIEKLAGLME